MKLKKFSVSSILIYGFLFLVTLSVVVPLLHLLAMSLSDPLKVHELSADQILFQKVSH